MTNSFQVLVWSKEGCSYCEEVKSYLEKRTIPYDTIDVTKHDDRRDILQAKYGVRYVPVVEIGRNHQFTAVTELGISHLEKALESFTK